MKQAILDTSFIVTCVKQKIDFLDEIPLLGFTPIMPKQVIVELQGLAKTDNNAKVALDIIQKSGLKSLDLKTKNTDKGIIKYAQANPQAVIATLDREIKTSTKNKKLVIRGKKKLEVI